MGYRGVGMDCPSQLSSLRLNNFREIRSKHTAGQDLPPKALPLILHVLIVDCCCVLLSSVSHEAGYLVEIFDGIFSLSSIVICVAWAL